MLRICKYCGHDYDPELGCRRHEGTSRMPDPKEVQDEQSRLLESLSPEDVNHAG